MNKQLAVKRDSRQKSDRITPINNWLQSVTHAKKAIASLLSLVFYDLEIA